MLHKLLLACFCLFFFACSPLSGDQNDELYSVNNKQIGKLEISYYFERSVWEKYINQIDNLIREIQVELNDFFAPKEIISVEIILLKAETLQAKFKTPSWVKAFYHKGRIFVGIKDNNPFLIENIKKTFQHELVHAYTGQLSNRNIPVWFDEGLAKYLEEGITPKDRLILREWLRLHKLIRLPELEKSFTLLSENKSKVAYAQAKLMIQYLFKISPKSQIREYLDILRHDKENAFKGAFSISQNDFLRNFSQWTRVRIKD